MSEYLYEQCKNGVLKTCSSPSQSIMLSVAVICLLTIIIHVIIIVVFTMTMKRKILQLLIFNSGKVKNLSPQ